jgi:hypothetical protein
MAEFSQPGHLYNIVSANMMHKCLPRCTPPGSTHCKFNFSKLPQDAIFQDEKGTVFYQRPSGADNLIEHSPRLLLLWQGHAHLQFFKTAQKSDIISKSGLYILKYILKYEPSFFVNVQTGPNFVA